MCVVHVDSTFIYNTLDFILIIEFFYYSAIKIVTC